jgi:hypothetical protein
MPTSHAVNMLTKARHARRHRKERDQIAVSFRVICTNQRHQISLTKDGAILLERHGTKEDLEATLVQEALSGSKCRCLQIKRLLLSKEDTNQAGRGRRHLSHRLHALPDEARDLAKGIDFRRYTRETQRAELKRATTPGAFHGIVMFKQYSWSRGFETANPHVLTRHANAYSLPIKKSFEQIRDFAKAAVINEFELHFLDTIKNKTEKFTWYEGPNWDVKTSRRPGAHNRTLRLTSEWVRDVYRMFNCTVVGDAIPLEIVGELGVDRYKVRAAVARNDGQLAGLAGRFDEVMGAVYKRPFGDWRFMELPEAVPAPQQVEAVA